MLLVSVETVTRNLLGAFAWEEVIIGLNCCFIHELAMERRKLVTTRNVGRTLEEFVNHSPAARDLQIFLVFYQHPAWFISL